MASARTLLTSAEKLVRDVQKSVVDLRTHIKAVQARLTRLERMRRRVVAHERQRAIAVYIDGTGSIDQFLPSTSSVAEGGRRAVYANASQDVDGAHSARSSNSRRSVATARGARTSARDRDRRPRECARRARCRAANIRGGAIDHRRSDPRRTSVPGRRGLQLLRFVERLPGARWRPDQQSPRHRHHGAARRQSSRSNGQDREDRLEPPRRMAPVDRRRVRHSLLLRAPARVHGPACEKARRLSPANTSAASATPATPREVRPTCTSRCTSKATSP